MSKPRTGTWDSVRQLFADQFEASGTNFVYRRSQRGEAIVVSSDEHARFLNQFDHDLSRAIWIIYVGLFIVIGSILLMSIVGDFELSQVAIYVGIATVMAVYYLYYRWVWRAPARALAGRTPIARELSSEGVRRLRFQRMTYAQLAGAAAAGVFIPFMAAGKDLLVGWNRLWLIVGAALVFLAVLQTFHKWRFDLEYPNAGSPTRWPTNDAANPVEENDASSSWGLLRYALFGLGLAAIAFIAFTPLGKRIAQMPAFFPIIAIGIAAWSLFTVVRGFTKGWIEPFVRGFNNRYTREAEPKRFWASMTWNAFFGGLCVFIAIQMAQDSATLGVQSRCTAKEHLNSPQDAISACTEMLDGKVALDGWSKADIYVFRGNANGRRGDLRQAIADYTQALQLQPDDGNAFYNRGFAYQGLNDTELAIKDQSEAIRLNPSDADALLARGYGYERLGNLKAAVADFSEVIRLQPDNAEAYYYRWAAYKDLGETEHSIADLAALDRLNPRVAASIRSSGSTPSMVPALP
jgi:tetratricopeptide (TPR) repeat protein